MERGVSNFGLKRAGWVIAGMLAFGSPAVQSDDGSDDNVRYLRGDYGFTASNNCVRALPHAPSAVGMDPHTLQLLLPGESIAQSGSGVMHFHEDGTMSLEAAVVEVNLSKTGAGDVPGTPELHGTCSGTYALAPKNRVTISGSCHIDLPTGGGFNVAPVTAEGFVGDRGRSIHLNSTGGLQMVTFALPNGVELKSERVCGQRWAFDKL